MTDDIPHGVISEDAASAIPDADKDETEPPTEPLETEQPAEAEGDE